MDFDYFVIGAGSGGIASARRAAEYNIKVGIAEGRTLGGTCVNRGCVPKKLMVYGARFGNQFQEAAGYGWQLGAPPQFSWETLMANVNNEVRRLNGIYSRMLDNSGVTVFPHYAQFIDAHRLQVGDRQVTAKKILIAVGGTPVKPPIPGIEHTITSDEIFHLPQQPGHLVILGGGYIAVEFACVMRGLGSAVTLIIRKDKILRGFDEDLRDEIQGEMVNQGIEIITQRQLTAIAKEGDHYRLSFEGDHKAIRADAVNLAATGRVPNLKNLGLENCAIETHKGAIAVNDQHQTSIPHIYAVGDCTDRVNLTPVAIKEGRILADREFGGKPGQMDYGNIPTAIFTTPEAGTVGLTEQEAIAQYGADQIKIYRSKFRPMYQALGGRQEKTLMKLVVHQGTDRVLGAHMVGDHAAEIIQGVAIAVKMGATKAQFDATVAIHPSSAEEFVTMR